MRKRSFLLAFAVVVGIGGVSALMHGCYWDDAVHRKYAKGSYLVTCRGICMNGQVPMANVLAQEDCKGENTEWVADGSQNGGSCMIHIASDCEALKAKYSGAKWVVYDYQVVQIASDRFVRFEPDGDDYDPHVKAEDRRKLKGKYYCGTFDEISERRGECTEKEKKEIDESFGGTICPLSAHSCSVMPGFYSRLKDDGSDVSIGVCSMCASNQLVCPGESECVSILTDKHCGRCNNTCGGDEYCDVRKEGGEFTAKCVKKLACLSNSGTIDEGYRICQSGEDKRCVYIKDNKNCGGCPAGSEDISSNYEQVSPSGEPQVGTICKELEGEVCTNGKCMKPGVCDPRDDVYRCYCQVDPIRCSADYTRDNGEEIYCIDALNAMTCGAKGCDDLGQVCKSNMECVDNNGTYDCTCPRGTFWVEKYEKCLGPNDDDACGIISETETGQECDKMTSACRDGVCECFSGTVLCSDAEGKSKCVRPDSPEFCGAKLNESDGKCLAKRLGEGDVELPGDYEVCDETQSCVAGKCVCNPGYAACDVNATSGKKCIYTRSSEPSAETGGMENPEATRHCGASGLCNSDSVAGGNFKGVSCDNGGIKKCVYDASTNSSECVCDKNYVMCNGKCINPKDNNQYCGADASCQKFVDCSSLGKEANCLNGVCECKSPYTKVWISEKERYECRDISDDGLCCGTKEVDGIVVCENNCWENKQVCYNGRCTAECIGNGIPCNGICIDEKDLASLHLKFNKETGECSCIDDEYVTEGFFSEVDFNGEKYIVYCNTNNDMRDGCEGRLNDDLNCGKCAEDPKAGDNVSCNKDARRKCGRNKSNQSNQSDKRAIECICEQPKDGKVFIDYCPYKNVQCVNLELYNMKNCFECKKGFADKNGDLLTEPQKDENGNFDLTQLSEIKLIDGCEVDYRYDVNNCGDEDVACSLDEMHATEVACVEGVCKSVFCAPGYADCDGEGTKCATDLSTMGNCRTCGKKCLEGQTCESNGCRFGDGKGCKDCSLRIDDCMNGLKLWRKCAGVLCWIKTDQYMCASEKPGSSWAEVK